MKPSLRDPFASLPFDLDLTLKRGDFFRSEGGGRVLGGWWCATFLVPTIYHIIVNVPKNLCPNGTLP